MTNVLLLVGTAKGLFRYRLVNRQAWESLDPVLLGDPIYTSAYDSESDTLYAGVNSEFYGASIRRSSDGGDTWDNGGSGLCYAPDDSEKVSRVWAIRPTGGGRLYAGVEASGLFRSDDGGDSWQEVSTLRDHPSHSTWDAGYGGKCLHTVAVDPFDQDRIYTACSTGGLYRSDNGGQHWQPKNHGIRADFMPEGQQYPESGQCVHNFGLSPSQPGRMWLQNHGGVYRSDDRGDTWHAVGGELPSDFGFPIIAHPTHPDTAYVIPLTPWPRWSPDNVLAVYRTEDGGEHWERLSEGLPHPSYTGILRDAFATDSMSPLGLYFGTTSGELYASQDEGNTWTTLAQHLPRIYSVVAVPEP